MKKTTPVDAVQISVSAEEYQKVLAVLSKSRLPTLVDDAGCLRIPLRPRPANAKSGRYIEAVGLVVGPPQGDSLHVHVPDATRGKIIEALAAMDDEAFSWLVLAMPPSAMLHGGTCQIWPDGVGGFHDRVTIEAVRAEAQAWIDARQK